MVWTLFRLLTVLSRTIKVLSSMLNTVQIILGKSDMWLEPKKFGPGRVAQSVTCLATDVSLTANPGVASSIQALSHTFVEIDHEIIATVILLPSAESFKKGCCQLQAKVCARSTR